MQHLHMNMRFVNQFRFNNVIYPCRNEKQYRQFNIRQFAGSKSEIAALGKYFTSNMSDAAVIARLVNQLENHYATDYNLLLKYAQNLVKVLTSQIRREPFTTHCCCRLLSVLQPFLAQIDAYHQETQPKLMQQLKIMLRNKQNPVHTSSDDVDDIMLVTGRFIDSLLDYCESFNAFLYDEAENKCGVALTTQLEQYLLQLTSLAERLAGAVHTTQSYLKTWKLQLADREEMQLYN